MSASSDPRPVAPPLPVFFFFNDTATTEIYTLSLHDALPISLARAPTPPTVMLVFGVNGVGKTTTVAKLAARLGREGRSVLLAAADTFRAGDTEQLQV